MIEIKYNNYKNEINKAHKIMGTDVSKYVVYRDMVFYIVAKKEFPRRSSDYSYFRIKDSEEFKKIIDEEMKLLPMNDSEIVIAENVLEDMIRHEQIAAYLQKLHNSNNTDDIDDEDKEEFDIEMIIDLMGSSLFASDWVTYAEKSIDEIISEANDLDRDPLILRRR